MNILIFCLVMCIPLVVIPVGVYLEERNYQKYKKKYNWADNYMAQPQSHPSQW